VCRDPSAGQKNVGNDENQNNSPTLLPIQQIWGQKKRVDSYNPSFYGTTYVSVPTPTEVKNKIPYLSDATHKIGQHHRRESQHAVCQRANCQRADIIKC
jgi:hypothetical protein